LILLLVSDGAGCDLPRKSHPLSAHALCSSRPSINKLFFDLAIAGMPGILASQPTITKERVLLGLSELRALTPLDRGKALKGVFEIVNLVLQVCEEVARMH